MPTVTVIIPTIGRPGYIADTVRSVLAQDYQRLKLLISDNAPAVPTAEVLFQQQVDDARIRIITRSVRLPFSAHMNACLQAADGDLVMILSDDDQLSNGYISEQVALFAANSNVTVGFGQQVVVTEHDTGLLPARVATQPARIFDGDAFLQGTLSWTLQSNVMTYISLFARRTDLLAIGGFKAYPDGSHADNFIVWQLALRGRVAVGAHCMLYRVYASSHGLSTPFAALLAATRAYTRDCAAALRADIKCTGAPAREMLRRLRLNNLRMLLGRLRTVYSGRMSKPALVSAAISSLLYALTPTRWM